MAKRPRIEVTVKKDEFHVYTLATPLANGIKIKITESRLKRWRNALNNFLKAHREIERTVNKQYVH